MKKSFYHLVLIILISFCTTAIVEAAVIKRAKYTLLSKKEVAEGAESIRRLETGLKDLDKEDQKLLKLLKNNKEFHYLWCRSVAAQGDVEKLKFLIKRSRKEELWHTVLWMTEKLEKLEPLQPLFYKLSAKSYFELNRVKEAVEKLETGMKKYPWSRRLRKLLYEIKTMGEVDQLGASGSSNPWDEVFKEAERERCKKEMYLKFATATVDHYKIFEKVGRYELCKRRTKPFTEAFRVYVSKFPSGKSGFVEEVVTKDNQEKWERHLIEEYFLPPNHEVGGPCPMVNARLRNYGKPFIVACVEHYYVIELEAQIGYQPFYTLKISDEIIEKAIAGKDLRLAALAAEYRLIRVNALTSRQLSQVNKLLNHVTITDRLKSLILLSLLRYTRRHKIEDSGLINTVAIINQNSSKETKVLSSLILKWCDKPFVKTFSDYEIALLASACPYSNIFLGEKIKSDRYALAYLLLKRAGKNTGNRLMKIQGKYDFLKYGEFNSISAKWEF